MINKAWFQTATAIVMTLIIITLVMHVSVIFQPAAIVLSTIFIPLLAGGLLYYITMPIQKFFERRGVGRGSSIFAIIVIILIVITALIMIIAPMIMTEIQKFVARWPLIQHELAYLFDFVVEQTERFDIDIGNPISELIDQGLFILRQITVNFFSIIANTITAILTLILIPFFFFFMLKDHEKFIPAVTKPLKGKFRGFITKLFNDVDYTLAAFVQGQIIVSIILAVMLYIGYTLIGLEYALLLAIFALFMNVIPFIGPWIAYFPALILALIQDPILVIGVSIITLVAQQIDGNIITPNVIGNTLKLHPLTVITIVLAAGNMGGFIAMLIAIPLYAVIKVIIVSIYEYREDLRETMFKNIE